MPKTATTTDRPYQEDDDGVLLVGSRVEKYFLVRNSNRNKRKLFSGEVVKYDSKRNVYSVVYEDGDEEELEWEELEEILVVARNGDGGAKATASGDDGSTRSPATSRRRRNTKTLPRVVTPESKDDGPSDNGAVEEEDRRQGNDSVYKEEVVDDGSQEEEEDEQDRKPPARKSPRNRRKTELFSEAPLHNTKNKKLPTRKSPRTSRSRTSKRTLANRKNELIYDFAEGKEKDKDSDFEVVEDGSEEEEDTEEYDEDEKKKKSSPRKTPRTSAGSRRNSKRATTKKRKTNLSYSRSAPSSISVAVRGLPQGSRAVGPGGFEIRALQGISPLLTADSVKKAIQLVAAGQHQGAARLLQTDHHSIRAFCQAACSKLGIKTTVSLQGGSELSDRARDRLEKGTVSVDAHLPGRLLVVRAGTLCPAELVDRVFESAAELHALATEPLATYDMEAMPDPSFGPWSVMFQRLNSSGLLPTGDEDKDTADMHPKRPFVVRVEWKGGDSLPTSSWQMYRHDMFKGEDSAAASSGGAESEQQVQWALLEGATPDAPPVILGVQKRLMSGADDADDGTDNTVAEDHLESSDGLDNSTDSGYLLPPLSSEVAQVRLPASLLQKAIRRNFCSPAPILEACSVLLHGKKHGETNSKPTTTPLGGVFEMLRTTWRCMLEDASPFEAPSDGSLLGFEELLVLSLIARADMAWTMPPQLRRKAVAAALRTQQQPANFTNIEKTLDNSEITWRLQQEAEEPLQQEQNEDGMNIKLQNALLVMRAAIGGKIVHRSSLEKTTPLGKDETCMVDLFEQGVISCSPDLRLRRLDDECRLAAYDPQVAPSCLLLVQATLPHPPNSWKKFSLPAISKQVRKLVTEANARMPDHHRLTRIAAWGSNNNSANAVAGMVEKTAEDTQQKQYSSAREVVASTGKLSDKEHQIVDCFEAVQRWRFQQKCGEKQKSPSPNTNVGGTFEGKFLRVKVGSEPKEHDGRIAFLLAFAKAEEIEVHPEGGNSEVVNVLFCGDREEPLLVQRIGKARKESAAVSKGPDGGSSGAVAVPSLGYVQRSRSRGERLLVEAAERAVSELWKGGRTVSLPLPPPGFQWNLTDSAPGREEEVERAVELTATLGEASVWRFTIGGVSVEPFDARKVISPCSLDTQNHKPQALGSERDRLLQIALYGKGDSSPKSVLQALARLHELAVDARRHGASEGAVYDWIPLATSGRLTAPIWRDAILALKTRENADVILGPVLADGTCKRDMTEGCLLRIFSVLESLYPTALIKSGALKWRVRPRGAGFHHMLVSLEQLSRGAVQAPLVEKRLSTVKDAATDGGNGLKSLKSSRKRPQRRAATACKEALSSTAERDMVCSSSGDSLDSDHQVAPGAEAEDYLPLPKVTTKLWPHQEASVAKVVAGVKEGRRGHADASAVGAGKTLTALATIVRLAGHMEKSYGKRNGVLVMLPTKALVKEWLLQIAEHTAGLHVIEQREDGQLFSLTYGKSTPPPPIDGNTIVITTLDRVREHPFVRQAAWDFVVIDECLAVQNAAAKRCPSAWRQIEVSTLGVLMLSATFFRSKYSDLFYMIRMLRTAFPRSIEWLSATIHEHIVCQVPETDRTWQMRGETVPLPPADLAKYRGIIEAYKRKQLNNLGEAQDFRRLFTDLETFLRQKYEGRESKMSYSQTSVMAEACFRACSVLIKEGHRPLVFADTLHEAEHLLGVLRARGLNARTWANVARDNISSSRATKPSKHGVIVAVKSVEGQGINMQKHADAIVCRPTPGDHLEQMKGRIDRPGQNSKKLVLVVLMAEHTIEEVKFANIHLAGNFFREYIAPVAMRYRERIDLEATLAAGGTTKLKRGTVSGTWRRSLEAAGRSGAFAHAEESLPSSSDSEEEEEARAPKRSRGNDGKAVAIGAGNKGCRKGKGSGEHEHRFAPLNKVLRNKGDPEAVRQAKAMAKSGRASLVVRRWLFPPKKVRKKGGLAKESLTRFSDAKPPLVLDRETVHKAVCHLSKDPKLAALIARVGADALIQDCGEPKPPTQAKLFNYCVRSLTFTMVSVDAGNAFLRRLAIKIGVCIEYMKPAKRKALLKLTLKQMQEGGSEFNDLTIDDLMKLLLAGKSRELLFTPELLRALVETCLVINGKPSGYPHLCGVTYPCGKNDNHDVFLQKAREHAAGGNVPVSAGYSASKASFLISMVHDFESSKITAEKIAKASDREAAKMLISLKGIGDWCAGGVLMHFLKRANIMLYGDLTIRNYLNDLYEINHNDESETMLESAADFPDSGENRNLIDKVATANGWEPYRTVVCLLMYHLQEENLVLL